MCAYIQTKKILHLFHSEEHQTLGFHFWSWGCPPTKPHYDTSIWAQTLQKAFSNYGP